MEPTLIYCVDVAGRVFTRGMYQHEDATWWSHPQKRVNPLERWKFHSTDEAKAREAAGLIRCQVKLQKELDQQLEALSDHP